MSYPDQSIPRSAVPLLSMAAFASGLSMRATDPLLPLLSGEFGVSLGDASMVITVFSISYGIAQLFFGPLGDRHGKYLVIAWAALASAAGAAMCALAPGYIPLLAARLLAGATAAAVIPLAMAWIGDVIAYDKRQPVLARFMIGQILGVSAGMLVGGLAADAQQWRLPFILMALIYLFVGIAQLSLNRRLPASAKTTRTIAGSALRHMLAEFGEILALPWARLVLVTVFLEGAFLFGPFAFVASHLHHTQGISLTLAGVILMLFGFGGLAFALSAAPLLRALKESGLALWGGVLLAATLVAIGVAPVWWWSIPAAFGCGFGFYMLHNTLQINATQMSPERRGAAVSAFAASFFLGQSLGVGIGGMLLEQLGTTIILVLGGAGALLVTLNFARRLRMRDA